MSLRPPPLCVFTNGVQQIEGLGWDVGRGTVKSISVHSREIEFRDCQFRSQQGRRTISGVKRRTHSTQEAMRGTKTRRCRIQYLLLLPVVGILGKDAWWKPGPGVNWDVRQRPLTTVFCFWFTHNAILCSTHSKLFVTLCIHMDTLSGRRVSRERAALVPLPTIGRPSWRCWLSHVRRQQFSLSALAKARPKTKQHSRSLCTLFKSPHCCVGAPPCGSAGRMVPSTSRAYHLLRDENVPKLCRMVPEQMRQRARARTVNPYKITQP